LGRLVWHSVRQLCPMPCWTSPPDEFFFSGDCLGITNTQSVSFWLPDFLWPKDPRYRYIHHGKTGQLREYNQCYSHGTNLLFH
jgi:hypothetical protein